MGSGAAVELSKSGGLVLRDPVWGGWGVWGRSHVCVRGWGEESAGCRGEDRARSTRVTCPVDVAVNWKLPSIIRSSDRNSLSS